MPSSACQTCALDRKSTRLNSSHTLISYAVFCLKKNKPADLVITGEEADMSADPHGVCRSTITALQRLLALPISGRFTAALPNRFVFFFNDTATTEIYTLSLHDALPILNSSHTLISYAVFCLRDESVTGV